MNSSVLEITFSTLFGLYVIFNCPYVLRHLYYQPPSLHPPKRLKSMLVLFPEQNSMLAFPQHLKNDDVVSGM